MLLAGAAAVLMLGARELRGELAYARFRRLRDVAGEDVSASKLREVVSTAPAESLLVTHLSRQSTDELADMGGAFLSWGVDRRLDRRLRAECMARALSGAERAVARAPSDYLCWLWLARAKMALSAWDEAEICLARARQLCTHPEQVKMFQVPKAKSKPAASG